uniref:Reverse transcriptase n=1 Tax=Macrostomum lignano TaxID=282301 RepID=A0A1I8FBE4_9PLAT
MYVTELSSPSLLNTVAMSTKSSHSPAPGKKGGSDGGKADESLMATIMSLIKKYDRLLNERPFAYKSCDKLIAPKPGTGGQFSAEKPFAIQPLASLFLARLWPRTLTKQFVALKRTLIDSCCWHRPYLLLLYYSVPLFEGRSLAFAHAKVKDSFLDYASAVHVRPGLSLEYLRCLIKRA